MKKHNYFKRLDRIRDGLFLPVDDKTHVMFYTLFGVPSLVRAISRAQKAGATSVAFVPANGGAVQIEGCQQHDHATPGIAVVYEIAEPPETVAHRPLKYCSENQLYQIPSLKFI